MKEYIKGKRVWREKLGYLIKNFTTSCKKKTIKSLYNNYDRSISSTVIYGKIFIYDIFLMY